MALLESHEVASFIVGFAVEPAAMKDTDPLEGESTKRSLMGASAFAVALVEGFGPEGARDGLTTHSMKVWRWKVGQTKRQWTQLLLPLRSVTGATPTYFWREAASGNRSRRSPKATSRRGAKAGPAPGEHQGSRSHDLTSRMREIRTSGSVGAPGEQSSGATRLLTWPSVAALPQDNAA
jgi:hypothetical protein